MKNKSSIRLAPIFTLGLALASLAATPAMAKPLPDQWFVRTLALAEQGDQLYFDDRSGIFGRLEGAERQLDRHDIPVFQSVSGARVAIAFDVHGDEASGQYLSNYQAAGKKRGYWDFTVYSNLSNADITLTWEGAYAITGEPGALEVAERGDAKLMKRLFLVDRETGEVIALGGKRGAESYSFNMGGLAYRKFRWVQGKVRPKDLRLDPAPAVMPNNRLDAAASSAGGMLPPPPGLSSGATAPTRPSTPREPTVSRELIEER